MTTINITGGEKLKRFLDGLKEKIEKPGTLQVGFFEEAVYPDGKGVPYIAACNEFGGTFTVPAHSVTIHRNPRGRKNKGQFVKASVKNTTSETYETEDYSVTIPPRPFFRRMVSLGKEHWGKDMAGYLKKHDYDGDAALVDLGAKMEGELQESIKAQVYHPLAASTKRKKHGRDQQLIDSSYMWNSVLSKVVP